MSAESFQYLLNVVGAKIEKKSVNFSKPISASERLCLTIPKKDPLRGIYIKAPGTPDWREISQEFESLCNLPHCIGAIDGKHIRIKSPLNRGSLYYNYKGYFNIILMAMCNAHYTFTLVDIESYESNNDSGVFCNSEIGRCFFEGHMQLAASEPLKMIQHMLTSLILLWAMKHFQYNLG
ncbi:uncharacterized protein LOC130636920 [Hydractinia symbiolongicarpus]|uniref:uncharacterized protein LOC130636920 n=1 Tax=Hydractinia symbiolongicarpus TaxID=13093 RepID=UPI00254AF28D|nr:uncharacterized protein LOC130636920 [Hydractinia symbiolongicarpus]